MNKIEEYRVRSKLTQRELADKMGVTQGAVCQWERGLTFPRGAILVRLSETLGCSIDELIRAKDQPA